MTNPKLRLFANNDAKLNYYINPKYIIWLPENTPFGNMYLKSTDIYQRTVKMNSDIDRLLDYFNNLRNTQMEGILHSDMVTLFRTTLEEFVYWIRKTVDELIGIVFVLEFHKVNNHYPKGINIDSIGKYFSNNPKNIIKDRFANSHVFLNFLNDVSNAYKHSFMNSEISLRIGNLYPMGFALHLKEGDNKTPDFYQYKLEDLVNHFNTFMEFAIAHLDTISLKRIKELRSSN